MGKISGPYSVDSPNSTVPPRGWHSNVFYRYSSLVKVKFKLKNLQLVKEQVQFVVAYHDRYF